MAKSRVKWTRDEVILAIDLYFNSNKEVFPVDSPEVVELSVLLNALPIIPTTERTDDFRNANGVHLQLSLFRAYLMGEPLKVGKIFIQVYEEFIDDTNALHEIANAIKNSKNILNRIPFGYNVMKPRLREGVLLSQLHCYIETEHRFRHIEDYSITCCTICNLNFTQAYQGSNNDFYELHLLVPPKAYNNDSIFINSDFVVVCPNCHKVLHVTRPWVDKMNVLNILM